MPQPQWRAAFIAVVAAAALLSAPPSATASSSSPPEPLPELGQLKHGGRWMVDDKNRVVIPHGLQNYTPSADDIPYLQEHGFTIVRIPFHMSEVEPAPGQFDDAVLADLKEHIDALGEAGIYTLLDAHEDGYGPGLGPDGMPAWMQDTTDPLTGMPALHLTDQFPVDNFVDPATNAAWRNLWHNKPLPNGVEFISETGEVINRLQDAYADMWRHVAAYFAGNPHIYAYDLLNEPWPGADYPYPTCVTVGCPAFERDQLSAFNKKVVQAIRTVDPQSVTSFEPNVQDAMSGQPIALGTNATNADNNSGINFHPYCLSGLWGAPGLSAGAILPNPAEDLVCNSRIDKAIVEVDVYQKAACNQPAPGKYCLPALISEFGASTYNAETMHVLARADQHMMPWAFFEKRIAQETSATAREQVISVIDRPYPYAVAGTPLSYSFSDGYRLDNGSLCASYLLVGTVVCPSTNRFNLAYSTTAANGQQPSGPTLVYAPKMKYPNGYKVSVSGGQVTSPPNAVWLKIESMPCATTVKVTIVRADSTPPAVGVAPGCSRASS